MHLRDHLRPLAACAALALLLAACGEDDGGEVRGVEGECEPASGSASASASASASPAASSAASGGSASASAAEECPPSGSASASASASGAAAGASGSASTAASGTAAECSAVGTELEGEATETVDIELAEYAFEPATVEVPAGVVTFATTNAGEENHELAFLPGGGEIPLTEDGAPDEEALAEAGAFELEAYGPGGSCNATYELEPGTYTMFCIVEAPDGETHASKGMVGELTVT